MDVIAAISKTWVETIMQARRRHGQFDVRWEDGSWSKHLCHPEFMKGPIDMQGTCIDLEAAYRQCPVAKDERKYTVFAVKDPQSKWYTPPLLDLLEFEIKLIQHVGLDHRYLINGQDLKVF